MFASPTSPARLVNLALAFLLELVMLAAWAWKGLSWPLPPLPPPAAVLIPLFLIAVWALFAAPPARFPLPSGGTAVLKVVLLGSGAVALAWTGQPVLGAADGVLIVLNLALSLVWGQAGPSGRTAALRVSLAALIGDYARRHPDESEVVARFREFLASGEELQGKSNLRRHITASTWIVDPGRTRVLLTHHAKLNIWVQLGGHTDEGEDWTAAALREAREESGLTGFRLLQRGLFDLDIHEIPARPGQTAHDHYDLRFLVEAAADLPLTVSEESHDLAWVSLADLESYTREESQQRMKRKT
jgi:8-oxo-dGTP pyrophosphatase MutT (NUDIX family)